MLSLALIVGLWTTTCIQTQMGGTQGYTQESMEIGQTGEYEFTREWYIDPVCSTPLLTENEAGEIKLGKKLSGMFVSGDTYEADFTSSMGKDLGAIQITNRSIKIGRGMKNSTMRNTMVGVFEYSKK